MLRPEAILTREVYVRGTREEYHRRRNVWGSGARSPPTFSVGGLQYIRSPPPTFWGQSRTVRYPRQSRSELGESRSPSSGPGAPPPHFFWGGGNISGNFQRFFRNKIQDISKTFPEHVPEMCGKFLGAFRKSSGKFPGIVRDISGEFREPSRKFPGNVQAMFRNFPEKLREISKNCPDFFRKSSGKCREISGEFPE